MCIVTCLIVLTKHQAKATPGRNGSFQMRLKMVAHPNGEDRHPEHVQLATLNPQETKWRGGCVQLPPSCSVWDPSRWHGASYILGKYSYLNQYNPEIPS